MKYKGYTGIVQFDDEAMIFHGEVAGIRDVITFRGGTPEEIKKEFEVSIDGYIDWCHELGQEPEKPFSGNIHLRLKPDLHAKLSIEAKSQGVSLNYYINSTLQRSIGCDLNF
jgi:predicted HicB family RNase H-like nuclease